MSTTMDGVFRGQLLNRRHLLAQAIPVAPDSDQLEHLLQEVDEALARLDNGTFGLCQTCHDSIEVDRLLADPLATFCLDHLTPLQQRALEQDLELASKIQNGLLPERNLQVGSFQASYRYEPLGPVSGDYCDLIGQPDGSLYFMLGDVAGKGVAASMLMAQLHGVFRTLILLEQPLDKMLARASRVFCESTMPTQFATLVCGRASPCGEVELCNAGHVPTLLANGNDVVRLDSTSLPIGMFCNEEFTIQNVNLGKGDCLVLLTDGISEAHDSSGTEYGLDRLSEQVSAKHRLPPQALIDALMEDLRSFRSGAPKTDDLSIMAIRRVA